MRSKEKKYETEEMIQVRPWGMFPPLRGAAAQLALDMTGRPQRLAPFGTKHDE